MTALAPRAPLVAAALAAAAALGFAAGQARPAAAAPPPPDELEHRVVILDYNEFKDLDEYKALEKQLKSPWRAQFAFQERVLDRAGKEGFRLVQVLVPKTPSESIFYLRKGCGGGH